MMHIRNAGRAAKSLAPNRLAPFARRALLGLAPLLAAAAPAAAQWYPYRAAPVVREAPLPPRAALRAVVAEGYVDLDRPVFTGAVYVVQATSSRGFRVRLLVDAFEGDIVHRVRLADLRPPAPVGRGLADRGGGLRPDGFELDEAPPELAAPPRRREAARTEPSPRGQAVKPKPAESKAAKAPAPVTKPEVRPEEPAKAVPAAPAPAPVEAAKPTPAPEERTAETPRGPVRVIEGVTPVIPAPARSEPKLDLPPEVPPPAFD